MSISSVSQPMNNYPKPPEKERREVHIPEEVAKEREAARKKWTPEEIEQAQNERWMDNYR